MAKTERGMAQARRAKALRKAGLTNALIARNMNLSERQVSRLVNEELPPEKEHTWSDSPEVVVARQRWEEELKGGTTARQKLAGSLYLASIDIMETERSQLCDDGKAVSLARAAYIRSLREGSLKEARDTAALLLQALQVQSVEESLHPPPEHEAIGQKTCDEFLDSMRIAMGGGRIHDGHMRLVTGPKTTTKPSQD